MKYLKFKKNITNNLFKNIFTHEKVRKIHGPSFNKIKLNLKFALERLFPLGGTSDGNKVSILIDGDKQFSLMKKTILKAKKSVWLETYTYEPDKIGKYILDALITASIKGCEVILLYDHFGSSNLSNNFLKPLFDSGAKALAFNPIWPWKKSGPFFFRDHRKLLIIDNKIGFCGGVNISQDYAGKVLGNGRFRDTLIMLKGPCVHDLGRFFWGSLNEVSGIRKQTKNLTTKFNNGIFTQVLGSNIKKNLRSIQKSIEVSLSQATKYCYLTSPYFLPSKKLHKAIIEASKRGVIVKILCAGLSDVPLMRMAGQHIYSQFIKSGIKIFEMFKKNLHAKTATIDGIYCSVGSFNLDQWSDKRNLEINILMLDCKLASELEIHFFEDLKISKEVTLRDLKKNCILRKILNWFAFKLMKL